MSKASKLIKTPHLYVWDGIKKRLPILREKSVAAWPDVSLLPFSRQISLATEAVFAADVPDINAALLLVKRLWHCNGCSKKTINTAKAAVNLFEDSAQSATKIRRLKILKAAIQIEAANISWDKFMESLSSKDDVSLALAEYAAFSGSESQYFRNCAEVMRRTRSHEAEFLRLLRDKSVSIAVVGNSPSENGKGLGHIINSHDVVIRFNNYSDNDMYASDYGTKTNIWMRAGLHEDVWRRPVQSYDYVLFSGPDRRYHRMNAVDVVEAVTSGAKSVFIPASVYSECALAIDHPPSAGILILSWLRKLRGPFESGNVSTFGFSFLDQPANKSVHYFDCSLKRDKYSHNWDAEAAFYKTLKGNT